MSTNHEPPPYLAVLGIAQDGGVPQAGSQDHPGWADPAFRRHVVCLGVVDPARCQRWLIEATPDLREQLHALDTMAPATAASGLSGLFVTHAHIGHYTGLMYLGHESMGTRQRPVYAMPRMLTFLMTSGPWSQLVRRQNIDLRPLEDGSPVQLTDRLTVTPFLVPHRQEYSEAIGLRIAGPSRAALFLPDIDGWQAWDALGTRIEDVIRNVDVAYLDGTFYADGEIEGRDMSEFPHPLISHTMARLQHLPGSEKAKVRFIHLNHTNPALWRDTAARRLVEASGFAIADESERFEL